jgi:hypothetical protein
MKQDGEQQGVAVKVPASADWLQQARSLRPGRLSISGQYPEDHRSYHKHSDV